MAMPAAADAVGLDVDGEGVDTVTVVVTLTEDRPPTLLFWTALKYCGNQTMVCNLTGCRTWQVLLASLPLMHATDYRPVDYFQRTFPTEFLESLCFETNRYYSGWAQNPNANEQIKKAFT